MIPYGRHFIEEDDIEAVAAVMRGALITQGPKAAELERRIADYVGAKHAVVVANGTAALHLACLAADIGPGDTLVTSPITFLASANCALYVGARPAFADIDPQTLNMDPDALQDALAGDPKIKAVVPVHFGGLPCDMVAISTLARKHGAVVIEDACHALGTTYSDGSRVGNCRFSEMTTFSFHPVKTIAAGEGGAITTNDSTLHRKLQLLRNHGMTKVENELVDADQAYTEGQLNPWYYEMKVPGFNYRMTDMQCALAISQFRKLDRFLARRQEIARRYDADLAGLPCLSRSQVAYRAQSANHLYVVRIDFARLGLTRAQVMRRLAAQGVGSQVHYIPVPFQPYYRAAGLGEGAWPHAQAYYEQALTIPLHYGMTEQDVALVIEAVAGIVSPARAAHGRPRVGA